MACLAEAARALGYAVPDAPTAGEFEPARADHPSAQSLYETIEFTNQGVFGEKARYGAVESLQMLDTTIEEQPFNRITQLMTKVFNTPVSLITLVADPSRVWFKSKVGPFGACVERDGSWCNYVLVPSTPEILITEDASVDARFAHNPFVAGEPFIKFYAGAPLVGSCGERYGTLCIVDLKQRAFTAELYALLINFAALAVEEIERNKPLYTIAVGEKTNDVQNNRHLDMSLTGAREGILLLDVRDADWPISYANPAFENASGLELDDLAGENFWELFEAQGKSEMDLAKIIGRGDTFEAKFFCSVTNRWLVFRLMPATTDRLAPSKATGIPGWVPSVDSPEGTKLGIDIDKDKIVDIEKRDLMDVVDAKCFWFAMVIPAAASNVTCSGSAGTSTTGSGVGTPTSVSSGFTSAFGEHSPPAELGQISLGPLLGSGSFGKVYRGTQEEPPPYVAIKVVDCRNRDGGVTSAQLEEVQIQACLDHPGVVKMFKHATSKDSVSGKMIHVAWIVQELCDLGQLSDAAERGWFRERRHIEAQADMPVVNATLLDIANAMAYVHSKNIIHSDLTSRNVLLNSSQSSNRGFVAKVCDFGLSRVTKDGMPIQTTVLGTITHMPPELLKDSLLDPACDVYSFGMLGWEMFYGKKCYCGKNPPQIIMTVLKNTPLEWPADAPTGFTSLMRECLAFEYKERPTFAAAAESLRSLISNA